MKLKSVWFIVAVLIVLSGCSNPMMERFLNREKPDANSPDGSKERPFLVATLTDLQNVGKSVVGDPAGGKYKGWTLSAYYKQTKGIDLADIANWTPIGDNAAAGKFSGGYNGGGYAIKNLTITGPTGNSDDYRGLFGYIDTGAAVTNVRLENISITNGQYVGGVVGRNDGMVEYCSVSGNITDSNLYSGGVAGVNNGTVRNSYSTAGVSDGGDSLSGYTGGVVGYNFGPVENCYFTGDVSGRQDAGGVVGYNSDGVVRDCYSTASISGGNYTGGVVGQIGTGTISNLVALNPSVTGTRPGRVRGDGIDSKSYARNDMLVNGSMVDVSDAGLDTIHGANISAAQWHSAAWWSDAANGPGFSDTAWELADNKLPILKGFPAGTQNPVIKLLPSVPVSGDNLAEQLAWLQTNAQSDRTYNLNLKLTSEELPPHTLSYSNKNNIIIYLNSDSKRTVQLASNGSLFTVSSGVTLVLDSNVTLLGRNSNNRALVSVSGGGNLFMKAGAEIHGNTNTVSSGDYEGGGVNVLGTFIMDGGKISENTSVSSGGGFVRNGTFIMNDGEIADNSAIHAGAIGLSETSIFTMNKGKIIGNTARDGGGGGVCVWDDSAFTMFDGEISGNTSNNPDSDFYGGAGMFVDTNASFTMHGGGFSGNTTPDFGGGLIVMGNFRMAGGTIYGSDATDGTANTASQGAALYRYTGAATQYGTFSGAAWISGGNLSTTNNTIKVVNGVLGL